MNDNPEETLRTYVRAFESLDPDAVVSFYHLPCMFITPMSVTLLSDADAARAMASKLIDHVRSQDYRRTDFLALDVKMLGQRLASLSGIFARFNSNGEEISRFGFAYTMHRDGARWQIVVGIAYDAPSART